MGIFEAGFSERLAPSPIAGFSSLRFERTRWGANTVTLATAIDALPSEDLHKQVYDLV